MTPVLQARTARVALVGDFLEEGWPSMDLVADMLHLELSRGGGDLEVDLVRPPMKRIFGRPRNADRLVNRFLVYPRILRPLLETYDLFHLVDHSYAHLLHELPAGRAVVTCHDLDTFRCLLEPEREPRGWFFRAMTARILSGFRRAARVLCVSGATRDELLRFGLVAEDRIRVVPNGVHPSCSPLPDPAADAELERYLGPTAGPVLLHVGSSISRKRIDVLLRVFARVLEIAPTARILRVGGALTQEQMQLVEELDIGSAVLQLPQLDRMVLAAAYRRADLVLQPSEAEGFGLPVVEGIACGTPVVASDLPVLREVGGAAVTYCPVGDVAAWADHVGELLTERRHSPERWQERRERGLRQAERYSWAEHAAAVREVYRELLLGKKAVPVV